MSRGEPSCADLDCPGCRRSPPPTVESGPRPSSESAAVRAELAVLILASLLAALSFLPNLSALPSRLLLAAAYLLGGTKVLLGAARSMAGGRVFGELTLMSVATIGALAIGYYEEAVAVMVLYRFGELLQDAAMRRSRASISSLLGLNPETVRVRRGERWVEMSPDLVCEGDELLFLPGERIALDGRIVDGEAFLDCSVLTGESKPRPVLAGSEILAGCLSLDGALRIEVLRPASESAVARIARLVEEAAGRKARTERWVSRFASVYTPIVVGLAAGVAILPPLLLPGQHFTTWLYRALVMLVISCPCALVLSVPLAYFCGLGACARRGIIVKGAQTLEALAAVSTLVFDKTGTLTEGSFRVVDMRPVAGRGEEELLGLAAAAESLSTHPMAVSIRAAAASRGLSIGMEDEVSEYREYPGEGVVARLGGRRIVAGNDRLLHRVSVAHDSCEPDGSAVNVALDSLFVGTILLGDQVKDDAEASVRALRRLAVRRIALLTGDAACSAGPVAEQLGIAELHADLLPEDKLRHLLRMVEETRAEGGLTAFVGDGINDAPVISAADVGIAMGSGSEISIQSADAVLVTDEPSRVAEALAQSRRTRGIVIQDLGFALAAKLVLLTLGAIGAAGMWLAVVGDVGVALAAVANSLRALRPVALPAAARPVALQALSPSLRGPSDRESP